MAYQPIPNPLPTSTAALTDGTQKSRLTNGTTDAGVESFGALMVNTGFQTLFYDAWSTTLDTTDKWTVTGTAPTIAGGNMQMPATASTYNALRTKDLIRPNGGFTHVRNGIQIEASAAVGAGRFWGLGTPATVPSATSLVQDGIGFEIDQTTGALLAVTYAAGVRTTVATLTRPSDGALHAYGLSFRVTQAYWYLDSMQLPVAAASFPNILVAELPSLMVRQNAASFTGTPAFVNIAHLTADTSRQGVIVSDPVIGTRQGRIEANGSQRVQAYRPATGTPGPVAASVTSVTLLAANANRAGATVYNDSTATLYLALAATASTTAYTVKMAAQGYYEVPFSYAGAISGIWSAANGSALVTELV